jgi:hypothetical protein
MAKSKIPKNPSETPLREGIDYTTDANGLMVFTAKYLLQRGYCCSSDCTNCPYEGDKKNSSKPAIAKD